MHKRPQSFGVPRSASRPAPRHVPPALQRDSLQHDGQVAHTICHPERVCEKWHGHPARGLLWHRHPADGAWAGSPCHAEPASHTPSENSETANLPETAPKHKPRPLPRCMTVVARPRGEGILPLFFRVEGASALEPRAGCPRHAGAGRRCHRTSRAGCPCHFSHTLLGRPVRWMQ